MPNVIEVDDPHGRHIICTEKTWINHILLHHPTMRGYLDDIRKTIQSPDLPVAVDAQRPTRNVYYGRQRGHPRYVKVVVEFEGEHGEVITAFLTDSPKAGEKPLWK